MWKKDEKWREIAVIFMTEGIVFWRRRGTPISPSCPHVAWASCLNCSRKSTAPFSVGVEVEREGCTRGWLSFSGFIKRAKGKEGKSGRRKSRNVGGFSTREKKKKGNRRDVKSRKRKGNGRVVFLRLFTKRKEVYDWLFFSS